MDKVRLGWVFGGVALAAAIGAGVWYWTTQSDPPPKYRFAKVERGPITAAITATGTVNPVITVLVGSQLSGQIVELMADFNTLVTAEQPLARLDTEAIEARLLSARADLLAAEAAVVMQKAQIDRNAAELENSRAAIDAAKAQADRARVQHADSEMDRARKEQLAKTGAGSAADAERAMNAERAARAALAVAEAQRVSADAALQSMAATGRVGIAQLKNLDAVVSQREAAVRQVEVDLKRSTIRSPIAGVVVQRAVDIGQTVAASLQAPTLFTIAQDLRLMEVHTTVDEADIGRVRPEQDVTFTVNAYPNDRFPGKVSQVRLAPTNIQNVITYTVVISADNSQLKLLPGMTATVTIVTDRRDDVLKVSNAALRYRPSGSPQPPPGQGEGTAPVTASAGGAGGGSGGGGGGGGNPQAQAEAMKRTLIETLKLDKAQIEQLDAIFAESRSKFIALMAGGASAEERRAKGRQIREEAANKIDAMLNPEQKEKYAELRARSGGGSAMASGTLFVVGDDGNPRQVRVRLGVSDGTNTEVTGAQLKAGMEVIVGGGPRAPVAASAPQLRM